MADNPVESFLREWKDLREGLCCEQELMLLDVLDPCATPAELDEEGRLTMTVSYDPAVLTPDDKTTIESATLNILNVIAQRTARVSEKHLVVVLVPVISGSRRVLLFDGRLPRLPVDLNKSPVEEAAAVFGVPVDAAIPLAHITLQDRKTPAHAPAFETFKVVRVNVASGHFLTPGVSEIDYGEWTAALPEVQLDRWLAGFAFAPNLRPVTTLFMWKN